jgi:hypothetical protein
MKRNTILRTLAAITLGTAFLQVQAQGIYVNKKNGESISYPKVILDKVSPVKVTSSTETLKEGAVATLQYQKIADMKTPRMGHQVFPSGDGFVVVGGHTTDFQLTTTAEIYQNGKWRDLSISSPHDGGFSVIMNDGRVMVGGGFSSARGVGQSKKTDIYNPQTQTFTAGPDMSVARAYCKAVTMDNGIYVNGNWYAESKVMDYYDGSSFRSVGNMIEWSNPYLFASKDGRIWTWSLCGTRGETLDFGTSSGGNAALLFNEYEVSTGNTGTYVFEALADYAPVNLTDDVRPSDSYMSEDDTYYFLRKNQSGEYKLSRTKIATDQISTFKLQIPTVFPGTQTTITYRGGVFANEAKDEVYLIGSSGTTSNQTVYLLSYNLSTGYWTIARAENFSHNLMSGAWTMLSDGRIVCTGGGINDNFDAQKTAYIFTPPTAGSESGSGTEEHGVNVWKTDGSYDTYMEDELESITTYEEDFDEKIVAEIPEEMLNKLGQYMPIYSGSTPPNIEGTYRVSPNRYVYDTTGYFNEDKPTATDKIIRFTDQRDNGQTIDYAAYDAGVSDVAYGTGAVVIGSGKNFTAFFNTEMTDSKGVYVKQATLVSGTITSEGIKDLYRSFLTVDKKNDDNNNSYMAVGAFRTFKDGDGISPFETWSPGSKARLKDGRASTKELLPSDIAVKLAIPDSTQIEEDTKKSVLR